MHARLTPAGWAHLCSRGQWVMPPHLELLLTEVLDCIGRGGRLLVSMPPRHGKSWTISRFVPGWYLGTYPDRRVILASYEADFASSWGRQVRRDLDEHGREVYGVAVAGDSSAAHRWDIEGRRGGMQTAGVGGPMTGKGADLLIVDDPVKNSEEADSATLRDRAWGWWTSTAYTRLEPGAAAIVLMTRWHQDDLAGRILANDREAWRVVNLPAVAFGGDALGRDPGAALWPARYDADALARIKRGTSARVWSALYQGSPTPDEGGVIKRGWLRFYKELPSTPDMAFVQSWDATFKDTTDGSWVVGQVWAYRPSMGVRYLVDEVRFRGDFVDTLDAIRSLSAKHPRATVRLIEEKANGSAILSVLKREGVSGVIPVQVDGKHGSKAARLSSVAPYFEAGDVLLPDPSVAPWIHDYVEELVSFPTGMADDRCDSTSQALSWIGERCQSYGAPTGVAAPPRADSVGNLWGGGDRRRLEWD